MIGHISPTIHPVTLRLSRYAREMNHATAADIVMKRWRIGRKVGKNIYAMVGPTPSDDDIDIGRMDDESLAANAVVCHNAMLIEQGVIDG